MKFDSASAASEDAIRRYRRSRDCRLLDHALTNVVAVTPPATAKTCWNAIPDARGMSCSAAFRAFLESLVERLDRYAKYERRVNAVELELPQRCQDQGVLDLGKRPANEREESIYLRRIGSLVAGDVVLDIVDDLLRLIRFERNRASPSTLDQQ
uniref:Uncharacterized protein n=1 Tax=Bosea sp. NBC_00436 TaxID=2969620 RepID=A0A9E7ZKT7_9HYPH